MNGANPIVVEVSRGSRVESRHRGAVAVVDGAGQVVAAWGDVARPVFPRSAIKPLQALPLIETGAADRFGVSAAELALACSSHSGAPGHVEAVARWLARLGLTPNHLGCGPSAPLDRAEADALVAAGRAFGRLHSDCSGKHAGLLTTAVHRGEPVDGCLDPAHPAQRRVTAAVAALAGLEPEAMPLAPDGCGFPAPALPLRNLALAMARLAAPDGLPPARAAAARRLVAAMADHPTLVAGRGRFDTLAIAASGGAVVTKAGAEGVEVAILPRIGLGIALKIDDGADRAARVAMAALLGRFAGTGGFEDLAGLPVWNDSGAVVGAVRPAPGWPT